MLDMWPRMKRSVVAKRPLVFAGDFEFGAWLSELVFIDRLRIEEADERSYFKDQKLWIFTEGALYNKGSIQPFKIGPFYLAIDAQIPIMPVLFSQYYCLDSESKKFEPGNLVITTLPPIPTKDLAQNDLDSLSDIARHQTIAVFNESSKDLVNQK